MAATFIIKGKKLIVDDQDMCLVKAHAWHFCKYGYAQTRVYFTNLHGQRCSKIHLLHRMIMSPGPNLTVDHINHNPLDNRRSNLRICPQSANTKNTSRHKDSRNRYKGVDRLPSGRYRAAIGVNYRRFHIGTYDTEYEAARAYNQTATKHFGEFASLNQIEGD